jgi:hypothetical protein
MILRRVTYSSISRAHSPIRNETTLASQFSAAQSFQGRGTLKRDEHNPEPLDAILRSSSALALGPATPQCADPELIAAYYDHSLPESDRDLLEAHFADCARCQTQLAAIARVDLRAAEARPALGIAWLRRWQVAIPALAAAAVLIVVIRAMRPAGEVRHADQVAMAKHEAPASNPAAAPASQLASAPAAASNELAMNDARQAAPPTMHHMEEGNVEGGNVPRAKAENRAAAIASAPAAKTQPPVARKVESSTALASGILPSVPKSRALQSAQTANPSSSRVLRGSSAIDAPVAVPETLVMISPRERPAESAQEGGPPGGVAAGQGAIAGAAIGATGGDVVGAQVGTLASNSSLPRGPVWMAGKHGLILFRDADGRTRRQYSGVEADLTAGAAPSEKVCWIVGRSGTIVRTIDGENWTKIASPTNADLFAVAVDSAEHAIITTVTAHNFETSDGGASWHPQ